jgi:hypothetical protein
MAKDIKTSRTYAYTVALCIFLCIFRSLTLCLILAIQLACAIIMSNYSRSHVGKGKERVERILRLCEHWNGQQSWDSNSIVCHVIPTQWNLTNYASQTQSQMIIDPTAAIFMSAVIIDCSAVLLYCIMGKGQHRDRFLVFGVLLGAISGFLASWSDSNLELLKDYIPISITGALTVSLVWHALISWVSGRYKLGPSAWIVSLSGKDMLRGILLLVGKIDSIKEL